MSLTSIYYNCDIRKQAVTPRSLYIFFFLLSIHSWVLNWIFHVFFLSFLCTFLVLTSLLAFFSCFLFIYIYLYPALLTATTATVLSTALIWVRMMWFFFLSFYLISVLFLVFITKKKISCGIKWLKRWVDEDIPSSCW